MLLPLALDQHQILLEVLVFAYFQRNSTVWAITGRAMYQQVCISRCLVAEVATKVKIHGRLDEEAFITKHGSK